ncbi:arylamine N-acetyltransferase 2 [Trichoderma novae-zelandiae]
MAFAAFQSSKPQESAYSSSHITAWLQLIRLPSSYQRYVYSPATFPETEESLKVLFWAQITTFPYENLSVHYSPTHLVNIHLKGRLKDGYDSRTHINNIIHLPDGSKFSTYVAFGGDGPTLPLRMDEKSTIHNNLGSQEMRLVHDVLPKQRLLEPKVRIYQYRNGTNKPWNFFYSFLEVDFFQEDFEVQNWWAKGEPLKYPHREWKGGCKVEISIVGKVMLVNNVIKLNMGGKTERILQFTSEKQRLNALCEYFGISLMDEERRSIDGWDMVLTGANQIALTVQTERL